ncbi:MAG: cytochrome P460 family protein [Thiotrichales bacterium]|nr:cytochrome P460 family protein [Thiotrichales bacterium]
MMKSTVISFLCLIPLAVYAGGNNDQVKYPATYQQDFTLYDTRNRASGKAQVVDLYANKTALESAGQNASGAGSILIMEVYKAKTDADGKPLTTSDGLYEKGKFAAVAVMEKRPDWGADYPAAERAGDWGFALYTPDGAPKKNDLDCKTCHRPLESTNYMFSYTKLLEHLGK